MRRPVPSSSAFMLAILALFGLVLVGCGDDDTATSPEPTTTPGPSAEPEPTAQPEPSATPEPTAQPEPSATPEPTAQPEPSATPGPTAQPEPSATPGPTVEPTATPALDTRIVNVYWLRDTQIGVGGRVVEMPGLGRAAMEALLAGPNQLESELGMSTAVPAGTEMLGLTISDGVATIDLSSEFEATGLGTSGEIGLVSQIVFTLTQFPTVDAVNIRIEGEERDAILSHGLEAMNLTREGFLDAISPAIVVESPYPGQPVSSPLTVTGFSRTFEATVVYSVTVPPSDEIVAEGFATAAQPDAPFFGPFDFTVEFEAAVPGFGAVIVFEESAQDGSQINIYEVPVMMEP